MRIIFCEDEGLRNIRAARKDFREQPIPECADDRADLVFSDDPAIQLVGIIRDVLVSFGETDSASLSVAEVNVIPGIDGGPVLADQRADRVEVKVYVHSICYSLLEVVFHYQVLMEKTEGLFRGRRGEADE